MADPADYANDFADRAISSALAKLRQNSPNQAVGTNTCVECGDDMPEARKNMGFKLCKPCAEEMERRKSLFAGD